MARGVGDPSGQMVATKGRKMLVAWIGNGTFASQSLPRDISLSAVDGTLRQAFVPELKMMRQLPSSSSRTVVYTAVAAADTAAAAKRDDTSASTASGERFIEHAQVKGGFQLEVFARFILSPHHDPEHANTPTTTTSNNNSNAPKRQRFGFRVLAAAGGAEGTEVGIDLDAQIVYVDGRNSNSCDAMSWLCPSTSSPARQHGLYLAGPLLTEAAAVVEVHCYVDGAYVSCIFNNQTAITAMVSPTPAATAPVVSFGDATVQLESWPLSLASTAR